MSKFTYIGFSIKTANVNHTALYKHAENLPNFKASAFQLMYYTNKNSIWPKDKSSREHDEVISRALDAMELNKQFVVYKDTRYVNIYAKIRIGDEEAEKILVDKLEEFIKKFQRIPNSIEIKRFSDVDKIKTLL